MESAIKYVGYENLIYVLSTSLIDKLDMNQFDIQYTRVNITYNLIKLGPNAKYGRLLDEYTNSVKFDFNEYISYHSTELDFDFAEYNNYEIILRENITHLILNCNYNGPMTLTNNLKYLILSYNFNNPIEFNSDDNYNLSHLTFGRKFNKSIILPNSLTHLIFGEEFNMGLELNENLIFLAFGSDFNQHIILPNSLTHLNFKSEFNQQLILPNSLTHLKLIYTENFSNLTGLENLKYLFLEEKFPDGNISSVVNYLPNNLKILYVKIFTINPKITFDDLPNDLKELHLHIDLLYIHPTLNLNNLPDSIEILELPHKYSQPLLKFPKNLHTIICSGILNKHCDLSNYCVRFK